MHQRLNMGEADYVATLAKLAGRIQSGDAGAIEQMYLAVMPGLRALLAMRVPNDLVEDYSHDVFLSLLQFIEAGSVRDLRCLPGIIRTIALRIASERRKASSASEVPVDSLIIANLVRDRRSDPEGSLQRKQRLEVALSTLALLTDRQREILKRFYLDEQPQEQICKEMGLTETQFRLLKSRAKSRFGELGRRRLRRPLSHVA